ncbi:MAG: phosphoglucomutase/phosphomannomutase family protein [Acidobacteria bacterium]|nr:phosphoglucomutase/phosphomannomutase family protein [Acidobacteriota bacterium]
MGTKIKFGTSGWRAIIADEFTYANVRLATEAIARFVKRRNPSPTLLVGYDTRFASENFGHEVARVLSSQNIRAKLCSQAVPTPAVAFTIMNEKLDGAINITASHNPGEYNGLKFSTSDGAPALPDVTKEIENEIEQLQASNWQFTAKPNDALIESIDIGPAYLRDLATKVNVKKIRDANLSIGYDALHGSGAGYLDGLLRQENIPAMVLHTNRDVYFGGHHPEPADEQLGELKIVMKKNWLKIGLATDGDADRFGVLDEGAEFIYPNELIAMLVDYLIESRGHLKEWAGGVARSVATTHLVDRVAKLHNRELLETPVGFKYIGEYIKEGRIILGGEESAGLSICGHVPEKDGILACLLITEMVASRGKSLKNQLKALFSKVGPVYNRRLNIKLDPGISARVKQKIDSKVSEFHGRRVAAENRIDGLKLMFEDGSWVLMRPSGTEPVVRYYAESTSIEDLDTLLEYGRQWITEA